MFQKFKKVITKSKIVFLILPVILFSGLVVFSAFKYFEADHKRFLAYSDDYRLLLKKHFESFEYGLQGTKGILVATDFRYDPKTFREYAISRDFFKNFVGALGFGFIRNISKEERGTYRNRRQAMTPGFQVHPEGEFDEMFVIEIIEPFEENAAAVGLNVAFEKHRKEAALKAATTGKGYLTQKITLVQMGEKHTGFLYMLPVYSTISTPATVKERMEKIVGWSYAPIVLERILKDFSSRFPEDLKISIQVGDDQIMTEIGPNIDRHPFLSNWDEDSILIGGIDWKISFTRSSDQIYLAIFSFLLLYVSGVLGIFILHRLANKAIQSREKTFINQKKWTNAIVSSSGHAIISTSPDGTILTFNPAAEKMLGYQASELIGRQSPAVFHLASEVVERAAPLSIELGQKIEPGFEVFVARAKKGAPDTRQWTYVRKNGSQLQVRLTVSSIRDENEEIIGYLGIAEDLTSELLQKEVIETQQAKMISASKMSVLGEMAGGVAHEINTPLTVIISKTSVVRKMIKSKELDFNAIEHHLDRMEKTANHISKIVKGLRLFSRNSGTDVVTAVNLKSVISLTLDLCSEKLKSTGIEVFVSCDEQIEVAGRESELSQVFMNLVGNSIDAIATLPEKWIKIEVRSLDHCYQVSLTDSGYGIPLAIREKMMNPFYTTKEVGKGTGLGLSISKGIIENFQGRLYYNEESKNTQFVVELISPEKLGSSRKAA